MSNLNANPEVSSDELKTTHCVRCQGFLVSVYLMDVQQLGGMWEDEQRCINCGWISPPMVLKRHRETNRGKKRRVKADSKTPRTNILSPIPYRVMPTLDGEKSDEDRGMKEIFQSLPRGKKAMRVVS